ncbi:MAG: geranylgeranyl reductase family protein [archaeon]
MYDYDVIVIGSGPAGSAAAEKCARYGFNTLILEQHKLPRDKTCGGMIADYMKSLTGIYGTGFEEIAERKTDNVNVYLDGKAIIDYNQVLYLFLRHKLDYLLTRKAIESGAKLMDECRADDIAIDKDKVTVSSKKGIFTSRIVVGADGVNSIVAKKTGLNKKWEQNEIALAIESEIKMSNKEIEKRYENTVNVYVYKDFVGYEWVFPKDGHINIGLGTKLNRANKLRERFDDMIKRHGFETENVKAHTIPMKLLDKTYSERVILCGDAGGFVYPLLGGGIEPGIRSGRAAADVCYDAIKKDDYSIKTFEKYEHYCKPLVKDINTSSLQLKMVETGMKYKLLNPVLINNFFKYVKSTFKNEDVRNI